MNYPSVSDFKNFFYRDFPYAVDQSDLSKIINKDIEKAQTEAKAFINEELFGSQEDFTVAFHYLSAHFLSTNIMASRQGLASQYEWNTTSKSAGGVSVSEQIPEYIMKNPLIAALTKTVYGTKYVLMILPAIIGNVFVIKGKTLG